MPCYPGTSPPKTKHTGRPDAYNSPPVREFQDVYVRQNSLLLESRDRPQRSPKSSDAARAATRPSPDALMSVFKGCGRAKTPAICGCLQIGCAGEEARQIDVGDQALIRVLDTALPNMRPRLSLSYCGRRQCRPQSVRREFLCRRLAPTLAQHMAEVEAAPVTSSQRAFRLPTQSRRVLEQSR
jgi:hypothetical protein